MNNKVFYLVYGIPGSGKSTYVEKHLKNKIVNIQHFEADMYFYFNKNNEYNFDFKKLSNAHNWCKRNCVKAMEKEVPVCVSNTSLTAKERKFYFEKAKEFNYLIYVHYCDNEFQNIHSVPPEKIQQMKNKLTKVTEEEIKKFNINFV